MYFRTTVCMCKIKSELSFLTSHKTALCWDFSSLLTATSKETNYHEYFMENSLVFYFISNLGVNFCFTRTKIRLPWWFRGGKIGPNAWKLHAFWGDLKKKIPWFSTNWQQNSLNLYIIDKYNVCMLGLTQWNLNSFEFKFDDTRVSS